MKTFVAILWLLTLCCWGYMLVMTHGAADDVRELRVASLAGGIDHLLAFGFLGGLLSLSIWAVFPKHPTLLALALPVLLGYAAIDETTRTMVTPQSEVRHWLADAVGASIAVTCMYLFCGLSSVLGWLRARQEKSQSKEAGFERDLGMEVESALASYTEASAELGDQVIRGEKMSSTSPSGPPLRVKARRMR